jgi:hypothetical protein
MCSERVRHACFTCGTRSITLENRRWRKPNGQSRMGNPEKRITLGRQDTDEDNKNAILKTKMMSNRDPNKKQSSSNS